MEYVEKRICNMYLQQYMPDPLQLRVSKHFHYQIPFLWVTACSECLQPSYNRSVTSVNKSFLSGLAQIISGIFMLLAELKSRSTFIIFAFLFQIFLIFFLLIGAQPPQCSIFCVAIVCFMDVTFEYCKDINNLQRYIKYIQSNCLKMKL